MEATFYFSPKKSSFIKGFNANKRNFVQLGEGPWIIELKPIPVQIKARPKLLLITSNSKRDQSTVTRSH
jgi:hypothetical protein